MFRLTVVTPERRLVLDEEITEVTLPGQRGELNILEGHAPLVTTLETGILRWKLKSSSEETKAVISWGYCEVHPHGVDVLADMADLPNEVNVQDSQKVLDEAQKKLLNETLDDESWKDVHRQISRAQAQIQLSNG